MNVRHSARCTRNPCICHELRAAAAERIASTMERRARAAAEQRTLN